jgi:hypothetical protein
VQERARGTRLKVAEEAREVAERRAKRHATARFCDYAVERGARRGGGIPPTKHRVSETPRKRRERRRGESERGRRYLKRDEYPRCHARPGSGPQPSTPKQVVASCAGLDPEGVYVYVERVDGRANRPSCTGRTVAPKRAARWKGRGGEEKGNRK